ncbi:MAG: phosphoribosylamine--glycine ligase, partial [Treponema sp.]|nr:phosphoribosylamine--glycine ligase [Treponema sp.]
DVTENQLEKFRTDILEPTLKGLIAEKMDYRGFIFFGIMLSKSGPKLLEYNVRLGDPETQAVLPLMDFDFAAMCKAIIDGTLSDFNFKWKKGFSCAPVAVSGGYPASYKKGYKISIDDDKISALENHETSCKVFIAGGKKDDSDILVTSGGRVLAASCVSDTFDNAWNGAYKMLEAINFTDMFYRKDIGLPGAAESL